MLAAKIPPRPQGVWFSSGWYPEGGRKEKGLQSAHLSHLHGDVGRWYSSSQGNFLIKISSVFVFQAGLDPGSPLLSLNTNR